MEERELFTLLNTAGDATFVVDSNGSIRYWSRRAEQLLGFGKDQVLDRNCAEVLSGTDEAGRKICCRDCRVLEIARKAGEVAAYDVKAVTADGGCKWLNISILVARLNRGRSSLVVHLMRDVDRRKQTELLTREMVVRLGQLASRQDDAVVPWRAGSPASADLTNREKRVLQLLSLGMHPKDVAQELHISPATVRNHIQHILAKLRCHSRLEAILQVIREGII